MLVAIVERILPENFFSPSLLPSRACPLVLLDYVQEYTPKLHAHLTELGVDLAAICFSWFLSLFTDCLPVEVSPPSFLTDFGTKCLLFRQTLFRVWDVFLMDGLDVLFRIALGILRSNEAELLRCESVPAVYVSLENLPTRMWEADKLLQVGIFSSVNFLNSPTISLIFFSFIVLVGSRPSRFTYSFTNCWKTQNTCRIAQSTHFLEVFVKRKKAFIIILMYKRRNNSFYYYGLNYSILLLYSYDYSNHSGIIKNNNFIVITTSPFSMRRCHQQNRKVKYIMAIPSSAKTTTFSLSTFY